MAMMMMSRARNHGPEGAHGQRRKRGEHVRNEDGRWVSAFNLLISIVGNTFTQTLNAFQMHVPMSLLSSADPSREPGGG